MDQPCRRQTNVSGLYRSAGPKSASASSLTTHLVAGLVAVVLLIGSAACADDDTEPKSEHGAAGTDAEMPQHRRVIPSAAGAPGTPLGDGIGLVDGTVLIGDPIATRHERSQGDDQSVTTVWKATSLIDGGDPLTIIDDYLAQAGELGMTDQTRNGCMLDGAVTVCSGQAATASGSEPRSLTIAVLRGWRADVLSDHVVVQHANGEAPWLETPDGVPPGEADVPAPPAPDDWPPLATVGESLGTASELERALVVEEGSRLAGPPHLTLEDATGGIEAMLEVTGDPHTVLRAYLEQIGKDRWIERESPSLPAQRVARHFLAEVGDESWRSPSIPVEALSNQPEYEVRAAALDVEGEPRPVQGLIHHVQHTRWARAA